MVKISYSLLSLIASLSCLSLSNGSVIPKHEGISTLVLLDNWSTIETHSIFFETLRTIGHTLTFEMSSSAPQIKYFEDYFFDNVILLAPSIRGNTKHDLCFHRMEISYYLKGSH
jgi:hypothetical protein